MTSLFSPLALRRGPAWQNRFALAPLTNQQSHADGVLSDDEYRWLTMRGQGGFGAVLTCASHVQQIGQGFAGQLGIWSDAHLPGLTRLAHGIHEAGRQAGGSVAYVQLHHAGMRTPAELIGEAPVAPSADEQTGARALRPEEIDELREAFIAAAVRAERAGFDGVEVHGAHGYILGQFLSSEYNRRDDDYGGDLTNRSRLLMEVIDGIRARCRADFTVGVRLSPERFGMKLGEIVEVAQAIADRGDVDFLDMSLWDVFKEPEEPDAVREPLIAPFARIRRGEMRLGVAGKIDSAAASQRCLDAGADFVSIGRAAILHHDFPLQVQQNPDFAALPLPQPSAHFEAEGVGPPFLAYLRGWRMPIVAD